MRVREHPAQIGEQRRGRDRNPPGTQGTLLGIQQGALQLDFSLKLADQTAHPLACVVLPLATGMVEQVRPVGQGRERVENVVEENPLQCLAALLMTDVAQGYHGVVFAVDVHLAGTHVELQRCPVCAIT